MTSVRRVSSNASCIVTVWITENAIEGYLWTSRCYNSLTFLINYFKVNIMWSFSVSCDTIKNRFIDKWKLGKYFYHLFYSVFRIVIIFCDNIFLLKFLFSSCSVFIVNCLLFLDVILIIAVYGMTIVILFFQLYMM